MTKKKIVILGAGYGGLITSKKLEKQLKSGEAEVTLINKHEYHYIATQLHKTGAGTACDEKIAMSIPELIQTDKIHFKKATVTSVDFEKQIVSVENGETFPYDVLLISLGFEVETFGIPGVAENAFQIRSFRSTKAIYNHIHRQFSAYVEDRDPSRLAFVVAGAGFTGVEMIGELVDALPKLCKTYGVPTTDVRIINVEASPTVLHGFDKDAVDYATNLMEKYGVELMTSTKILACTPESIELDNGSILPTRTMIWSGGVRGNRLLEKLDIPTTRGRVPVDPFLRVEGMENVFCIGDASAFKKNEKSILPPTAQVALQQADVCGRNIVSAIRGESLRVFEYHHKGTVASIGSKAAVGKVGKFTITGTFAAFMKIVIEARYILNLGGPRLLIKQFMKSSKSSQKKMALNK